MRILAPSLIKFSPTLQKTESFRVKASEDEVVVLYFEPSATQNLKLSGFPEGETIWQNRPHPSNSPMKVSKKLSFCNDIGNNCRPLSNFCHVVYATKGFSRIMTVSSRSMGKWERKRPMILVPACRYRKALWRSE